jgi:hypothetical protein
VLNDASGQDLLLAESMARRICHDFAGLAGTLDGLTELAGEDPEAAALAHETARLLALRLRLLRGAWGGVEGALDGMAIAMLACGLPGSERLHVECGALRGALEGPAARLCLCMLVVGAGGMPRGGTISLGGNTGGIWLRMQGKQAAWPQLHGEGAFADPRGMPAWLCHRVAAQHGWHIATEADRVVASPR